MCIRYANCGGGLIMPAVNAKSFSEGFTKLVQQKIIYTKERYSKKPSLKTNCTTTRLLHLWDRWHSWHAWGIWLQPQRHATGICQWESSNTGGGRLIFPRTTEPQPTHDDRFFKGYLWCSLRQTMGSGIASAGGEVDAENYFGNSDLENYHSGVMTIYTPGNLWYTNPNSSPNPTEELRHCLAHWTIRTSSRN